MSRKVYYTDENRQELIDEATVNGEFLVEDAITLNDGNYLVFDDAPIEPEQAPEERIAELEVQLSNATSLLNDATSLLIEAEVL